MDKANDTVFLRLEGAGASRVDGILAESMRLKDRYSVDIYRARNPGTPRREIRSIRMAGYLAMHFGHVFSNRDFAVVTLFSGGQLVQTAKLLPRYLRFPFMDANDLTIAEVWTHPDMRGIGLAKYACALLIASTPGASRCFWYFADLTNTPSLRVAEALGFRRVGYGRRTTRYGLRILGQFEMNTPTVEIPL